MSLLIRKETCDDGDFTISNFANGKLHSFWTHDGSIIVKHSENSGFMTVKIKADIQKLGGVFTDEDR
jgi:hypothetical protein